MIKKVSVYIVFVLATLSLASAQEFGDIPAAKATDSDTITLLDWQPEQYVPYKVEASPLLDTLMQRFMHKCETDSTIQGFRIQAYFGSVRKDALDKKGQILQDFPDAQVYLIYQQPYFKLRVGDFRDKFEAQYLLKQLSDKIGKVFLVPDRINLPKL